MNRGVHTKDAGTTAAGGLVARAANRHRGKDNREAAGVLWRRPEEGNSGTSSWIQLGSVPVGHRGGL